MTVVSRLASLFLALALVHGCSSPDTRPRIERFDRAGFGGGTTTTEPASGRTIATARAIVATGAASGTYDGTVEADGSILFASLPPGQDYVVELVFAPDEAYPDQPPFRSTFPMSRDHGRLGDDTWARGGIELASSAETGVSISATGLTAWNVELDELELVSRATDFDSTVYAGTVSTSAPAEGATGLSDWSFALTAAGRAYRGDDPLLDASAGDDLLLLHRRGSPLLPSGLPDDAWAVTSLTTTLETAPVTGVSFADGTTTAITGAFTTLPTTPFEIDLRGSDFLALRDALGWPAETTVNATVSVVNEPGSPSTPYYTANAPLVWGATALTQSFPVDPTCYPNDEGTCDTTLCPAGCNSELAPQDPGDLHTTIEAGHPYTDGRDVLSAYYSFLYRWRHPETMDQKSMSGVVSLYRPAVSGEAITVELSPPRNIALDGTPIPVIADSTQISSATPVITFDPPATGTPGFYRVEVVDQTTATSTTGAVTRRRTIATIVTLGTSVQLPEGTILPGRYYFVRVTASSGAWNDDFVGHPLETSILAASNFTGAFRL